MKKFTYILSILCLVFINQQYAQTILLDEDFSGGTLPSGWSNIDNGSSPAGDVWQFDNPGNRNITAGNFSGNYAILDSDTYGRNNSQNATLETSSFNASNFDAVTLVYDYQYRDYRSPESCTVEVYNGSVWTTVASYTTNSGDNYNGASNVIIDITTEVANSTNAKIRFTYTGDWDWWWALDNIQVTGTSAPNTTSGFLGPGGVGNTDGTTNLSAWYLPTNLRASGDALPSDGSTIATWLDHSGNNKTITNSGTATYEDDASSVINGYAVMNADDLDREFVTSNSVTAQTLIAVNVPGQRISFSGLFGFEGDKGIRRPNNTNNIWQYAGGGDGVNNDTWSGTTGGSYVNGSTSNAGTHNNGLHIIQQDRPAPYTNNLYVGGYYSGRSFSGEITEIIAFNETLNLAERIIVQNYLAAKYGISLVTNDFYTQDNAANGNFDHNVAGIGKASDNSQHTDSQGTGIIRINTPSGLGSDSFLFWGENQLNATYEFSETSVATDYLSRLNTNWRVSKRGSVGTVSFSVDASNIVFNSSDGCNSLKLIVSSSSDFSSKTTYDLTLMGGVYSNAAVNFEDGDYFTLEYQDLIVVDGVQFYNGSGANNVPDTTDDCYKLLVKSSATGDLVISEDADVREVEIEAGGKLLVSSGKRLQVAEGIDNSGEIRLVGTSQLLQIHSGTSKNTGNTGVLYIDQQGTNASKYRYNYWSSPVVPVGNSKYSVGAVLKDGTIPTSKETEPSAVNFTSGYDGDATTSPITISSYWIYQFNAYWAQLGVHGEIDPGLGYSMKGPGAIQGYTFVGVPNDGEYKVGVTKDNSTLVGNPYPSAIDADAFLALNNEMNGVIDGSIYFWEHNGEVSTNGDEGHYKSNYQGGYAIRNKGGGVAAVAPPGVDGIGNGSGIEPGQYIAVGQGFFVNGLKDGDVVFNNSMRAFKEEGSESVFFKNGKKKKVATDEKDHRLPSIRLGFDQENEDDILLRRQLLAVFKEGLTDDYDNGYDSSLYDIQKNDAYWLTNETDKYVITGRDEFSVDKELAIEVSMEKQAVVSFEVLEKYDIEEKVYLHDKVNDIYYGLNGNKISLLLEEGVHTNRFYLTFKEDTTLDIEDEIALTDKLLVYVNNKAEQLVISSNSSLEILKMKIFDVFGNQRYSMVDFEAGTTNFNIDIQNLKPGVYIIQLDTSTGVISKKVLIK